MDGKVGGGEGDRAHQCYWTAQSPHEKERWRVQSISEHRSTVEQHSSEQGYFSKHVTIVAIKELTNSRAPRSFSVNIVQQRKNNRAIRSISVDQALQRRET